ncbi:MAG: hypothetical protein LBR14_00075 [Clostridiales Family XIII bacterium]|nr:hypothetical protein [Clostridiales Family XIII bacterium]
MFRKVEAKKEELFAERPFSEMFLRTVAARNLLDFAFMNLKLEGSKLTEQGVSSILRGEIVPGVSIGEHNLAGYHRDALALFDEMRRMKTDLDRKELARIYEVIWHVQAPSYRVAGKVLYHLDYVAPVHMQPAEMLDELFRYQYKREETYKGDYILRAVELHDGIIGVYPYEEGSELLARCALTYELLRHELPVVGIGLREPEYNEAVSLALNKGDHRRLYEAVCRAALKKLDYLIELARA